MTIPGMTVPASAAPTIDLLEVSARRWKFVWLKYVRGVNLDRHCARSLIGPYSKLVGPGRPPVSGVQLVEHPAPVVFYLCGVTQAPARWADNAHCAFAYEPGHTVDYRSPTGEMVATIRDARQLHFGADDIDPAHRYAGIREYRTCRNWQFAHALAATLDGRQPATAADVDWAARMLEPPA